MRGYLLMVESLSSKPPLTKQGPDIAAQTAVLQILYAMPIHDAIGVACSYLLHCSFNHRDTLRAVMNEKIVREGFSGISLLERLRRVCQ